MSKWPEDLTRKRTNSNIKNDQNVSNKILLNIHKYKLYPAPEGVFVNKPNLNKQLNFTTLEETMTKEKISLIGDGSFSKVFLYQDKKTKIKYAVKKMLIELVLNRANNKNIIDNEISIQSKIIHPNIIRLYNYFLDKEKSNYYLILEYASHGTLFEKIRFKKGFEEPAAFYYFIQAVNAVFFLHKNHIVHRDIKPENLLVNENNILKLCDFGWSVYLFNEKRVTFCGTVEYMAPEILKSKGYGFSIDIWSLGILLYELIHAFSPFAGNNLIFDNAIEKNIISKEITFKKEISDECKDLILKLLMKDESKRIKLIDVYQHPFILRYVNMIYHQLKIPIKNINSNNKNDSNDKRITPLNSNRNKIKENNNQLNKSKITENSNESSQESSIINSDNIPKEPQVKKVPINSINSKISKEKEKEKEKNKINIIRNRNARQANKNNIRTNKTYVNTNNLMETNHKKTFSLSNLLANDINKGEAKKGKYHKVGTHDGYEKPKVKLNKYNLEKLLSNEGSEDKLTINIKKTSPKKNNRNRIAKIFNSASNKNLSISKQQTMTSQHLISQNSKNEIKRKLINNYTTTNLLQKPKIDNHHNHNHNHNNKRNHDINGSHFTNSRSITFLNTNNNNKNDKPLGGLGSYIIYSNPNTKKKNHSKNKFPNQRNHVINLNKHYNLSYTDLSNRNSKNRHPKKIALNLSNLNEVNSFDNSNEENSNSIKANKFIQKINTFFVKDQLKNSIPHISYSMKNNNTDRRSPKKSYHLNKINSPSLTNSETRKKCVLKYMRSSHNHNLFFHYSGLKNTEENEKNETHTTDSYRNQNLKHSFIPQVKLDLKKNKNK